MDTIMLLADMPSGFWPSIIGWFGSFITSYGWTIIVFTIALKLVLSPLDFWQKLSLRKTQRQQALLAPELQKIQEKFSYDKNLMQQKQMELYKKNKINPAGGCLPMLVYMVLTLAVFLTLFSSMTTISQFKIKNEYQTLQNTYVENYYNFKSEFESDKTNASTIKITYENKEYNYYELAEVAGEQFDTLSEEERAKYENKETFVTTFVDTTIKVVAQDEVLEKFNEIKQSWLWIKNIFRPDNYSSSFPDYAGYIAQDKTLYNEKLDETTNQKYYYKSIDSNAEGSTNGYYYLVTAGENDSAAEIATQNAEILTKAQAQGKIDYNNVTLSVQNAYSSWNGYFILVIMAAGLTLLSQLLASVGAKAKNKNGETVKVNQQTNKIMLVVMPLIMVWFTWGYSALFAIYIVTNSAMSILINYLCNLIINKIDGKRANQELVTISMKDRNMKTSSKINTNAMAHEDYRIQKKGEIIYEKLDKKSKKEQKNSKKNNNKGEN